jgi:hypothetical protein
MMNPEESARVWSQIRRGADSDCWPWLSYIDRHGYGLTHIKRKTRRVTRLVLAESLGRELLPGMLALHACDNSTCCNPSHLYEGDHKQNTKDALARSRLLVGENSPQSRLTDAEVKRLREEHAEGASIPELAQRYEVGEQHITRLTLGQQRLDAGGPIRTEHIKHRKVTAEMVDYILTTTDTYDEMMAKLGLSRQTIADVRKGRHAALGGLVD